MHKGGAFKACQGIGSDHLCCNYWVMDLISNCPCDCTYCILQSYLANNPFMTVYVNIDEILTHVGAKLASEPDKKFRVGTGELSDSLAIDPLTEYSRMLIPFFALQPNAILELKTKTANVDQLLDLKHNGHTVIAWSVNPPEIIAAEEKGTATLDERLAAAQKCIKAGYKVAFHLDPIIRYPGWEDGYKELIKTIGEAVPKDRIAWTSMGTLRFPPDLKSIATKRFPQSKIFYDEFVQTNGKMRYFRPIRTEVYKKILEWVRPMNGDNPLYFCMETETVWKNLIANPPADNEALEKHVCSSCSR